MDFRKSEEQELLLESLEEWLMNCGYNEAYFSKCYDECVYPKEYYKELFASPFGKIGLPEEYGGTEIDSLTLVMLNEKNAELGFPSLTIQLLALDDIIAFGSEEQKKYCFEAATAGEVPFCMGFTEPQAGSDASGYATTATRRNGKVYINGHKSFITHGAYSKYMLTMCRNFENGLPANKSMSLWFVPLDVPGVKREPMHKIGTKMYSMCEVYLDDVEVDESALVGEENKGFFMLMKNFEIERLLIASTVLGQATRAFDDAVAYAAQREQFGQKIGSYQLVQEKICRMKIKVDNMRNMIYKTAWERDNNISIRIASNLVKLYCTQAACEVADDAMQIFGGIGYTEDCNISKIWRDVRTTRIGGGTDEILISAGAREILKPYMK